MAAEQTEKEALWFCWRKKKRKKREGVGGIGSKGSLGVANVEVKREPCNWNWAALFSDMLMKVKLASNQVGSFEKWQNACTANMKPVKTKLPLTESYAHKQVESCGKDAL